MFSTVEDITSTVEDVQNRRGYHEKCGVIGTVGDIMSTMGDILSTVGNTQYHGGSHDARRDIMSTVRG